MIAMTRMGRNLRSNSTGHILLLHNQLHTFHTLYGDQGILFNGGAVRTAGAPGLPVDIDGAGAGDVVDGLGHPGGLPDEAAHIGGHLAAVHIPAHQGAGSGQDRRGYRQEQVEAPLNEVLAAGMVLMTGWRGECDLIDPMCGSGTIPIEAALIARNIAPGVFRKGFAFEKWVDFDSEMFDEIYNDDSQEREFTHKIYGYDNSPKANEIATHNIKAAGVSKDVTLKLQPFQQFEQPQEKSIIVMNPPYGERISTNDLLGLYQMIGERLKHAFVGNEAWVLSYREECFDQIGLKPSKKVPLFNGALECEFRKYEIFDGKYKEFKSQEGEGEEKKETEGGYDTPRPRERKEFKPRREGEYKPRREGEFKPRKEGDFKPRREEGSFTRDDRDKKPRGEFRGERDSRAPREFRGNREPRIPKKEEE